jgi:allantoin racemase
MVAIAGVAAPRGTEIVGATAALGPPMITTAQELADAAPGVVGMGLAEAAMVDGIIVGAFGDPGLGQLRALVRMPVVGIAEAAMLEAAEGGRRFGIATVTPALAEPIAERVRDVGLAERYTGIRLTPDDPIALTTDPVRLVEALAEAVRRSIDCDGAGAVVIGGGPLGEAAIALAARFATPIIAPIPAAVRHLLRTIR